MRSLGTIRARVKRLASDWPSSLETTFIHWMHPIERCPACSCDLVTHTREVALAAAVARRDPREAPAAPGVLLDRRPSDVSALRRTAAVGCAGALIDRSCISMTSKSSGRCIGGTM